ncbi:E3 ubiquitin-protein ligase APD2-like isoform X1 [Typha latifolia]|uniref:E3 ubiquitin-protein ligase APD2-like isoform X1 n=1 Tax=Typha latifolia TaxID=4733 RepID=UPI003C2CAE2F
MEASSSRSATPPPPSSPPPQEPPPQTSPSISDRIGLASPEARDDALSCLVILLTFWIFAASMTLILGLYASVDFQVGPYCSRLLQTNSIFVQDIKVKAEEGSKDAPMLYGFREAPPLDVLIVWSESHNVSVPANFHKEWMYYLNRGAQVEIAYNVKSEKSFPLNLIIAQGKESLLQWIENPSHPNTTLSWNLIQGNGVIKKNIEKSYDYYVAVGNLNSLDIEVQLSFRIQSLLYNTTGAFYKCSLDQKLCVLRLFFFKANVAILASGPRKLQDGQSDEWYVKLSYGPRWITYFVGSGLMTAVILLVYKILNYLLNIHGDDVGHQTANTTNERTPLLTNKEDDNLSLGSSYESVSHDEEDIEECLKAAAAMKSLEEPETNHSNQLCAICCNAHRDCFFLPCGHSATCYTCGTRISEEAGTCPICRRKMKKVRRIFAV